MEVTCSSCKKKINVPDEKIPKGQPFSFNCPSCKSKITISQKADHGVGAAEPPQTESFAPGSNKPGAMVCHPNPDKYKRLLENMGYQVHTPVHHVEAINNIRFNQYKVILVTEEYEAVSHDGKSVLNVLQTMNMSGRRNMFVIYLAPNLASFDNMEAFAKSVNALISKQDIEKDSVKIQIIRSIEENDMSYKVLNEVMAAIGKV